MHLPQLSWCCSDLLLPALGTNKIHILPQNCFNTRSSEHPAGFRRNKTAAKHKMTFTSLHCVWVCVYVCMLTQSEVLPVHRVSQRARGGFRSGAVITGRLGFCPLA